MNELMALEIGKRALEITLLMSAPMMLTALVVGLFISVIQALTQIQEVTLSYVPKILAVFGAMAIAGPWLISTMLTYTVSLFSALPSMVR